MERHERRVFGVAWSRLGDVALAEEATQETFIKGFHRLWLLADGTKFSGWIASIARNTAINVGLRHRRELEKRERWALDQPVAQTSDDSHESYDPDTLQKTLTQLSPVHRECLVLFYLEGKSGEEAAKALGISESAFRVRLLRAKGALREKLELALDESLTKLRPSKPLVPAIMLSILTASSAQAAVTGAGLGLGAKVFSSVSKSVLPSLLAPFLGLIGLLPGMLLAWRSRQLERENFREPDGFRTRLHDHFSRSFLWGFPLLLALFVVLQQLGTATWGLRKTLCILTLLLSIPTALGLRLLTINRNRFYVVSVLGTCVIYAVFVAVALDVLPMTAVSLSVIFSSFISLFSGERPVRMDYNLFLRAVQNLLVPKRKIEAQLVTTLNSDGLLSFARFLGSKWLANDYRWNKQGLQLFLPPVKGSFLSNMMRVFIPFRMGLSSVVLQWDGLVSAHLGREDLTALHAMEAGGLCATATLEKQVEAAVAQSWRDFRAGDLVLARRSLGEISDEVVFLVPPVHSKGVRWQRLVMGICLPLFAGLLLALYCRPLWFENLKPVARSEMEIRSALREFSHKSDKDMLGDRAVSALLHSFVRPAKEDFEPETLRILQSHLLQSQGFGAEVAVPEKLVRLNYSQMLGPALAAGWFTLADFQVTPEQMAEYLHKDRHASARWMLSKRLVRIDDAEYTIEILESWQMARLRFLRQVNSLDLLEREKLIRQLASWQVTSAAAYADRPPLPNWRQARGLFATVNSPVLADTYNVVAALELLGGLDRIDREACIQGVLRLHRGEGFFFGRPMQGERKLSIRGDARDTFCAFEVLRILDGLNRIDDLADWKFRVRSNRQPDEVPGDEIEAWLCQQRLQRVIREQKENPQAPVRSLSEP
ncbi:MAG TPA: sigma-70 family RNA polymerase sigma factor [Verrucomicrobiae bacterium]